MTKDDIPTCDVDGCHKERQWHVSKFTASTVDYFGRYRLWGSIKTEERSYCDKHHSELESTED